MSLAEPIAPDRAETVLLRLRHETAEAHRRLEDALDILAEPLSRDRFTRLLQRFWGFHAVWEPAEARALDDDAFLAPRLKLARLEADLIALGMDADEIAALPRCLEASLLTPLRQRPAAALGALYVLEGSTLGGQVISRALMGAPWLPPGGLGYFDPYGPRTGEMWRGFRDYALLRSTPAADAEMVAVAQATFERLQAWLA